MYIGQSLRHFNDLNKPIQTERFPIMCGILGEIRFDSQTPKLQQASDILTPRGSDGAGLLQMKNIAWALNLCIILHCLNHFILHQIYPLC